MDQIPKVKLENTPDYEDIFYSEIGFLSKVVMLYNSKPERQPYGEFIEKMKAMIANHSMELLS